jgi:GT2 family glycosyltransferase
MVSPRVSVIIPNYNRANLVGQTIQSMEQQSLPPHEIIVVDDGSTDGSVAFLRSLGDRIVLIEQANAGPGAARNAGLARATGDYIQFFDSDDLCTPDKIERQVAALEKSGADIAYGPWAHMWIDDGEAVYDTLVAQQGPLRGDPLSAVLSGWTCLIPCCVMRREAIERVGGYPTAVHTTEDLELIVRALLAGLTIVHAPLGMALIRQHHENQISNAPSGIEQRLRDRARYVETVDTLLAAARPRIGLLARYSWALTRWSADRAVSPTRALYDPLMSLAVRSRQSAAGVRARFTGTRRSRYFASGPIAPEQIAGIRALGLEPVRR